MFTRFRAVELYDCMCMLNYNNIIIIHVEYKGEYCYNTLNI